MGRPLSVLVVEDSPDDAALMVRELERSGFEPTWKRIETAAELRAALTEQEWDVCFADYNLPSFSATEALDLVRASHPRLPFIVVSGTIGVDRAVGLMRAGANDYFLKGHLERFGVAVANAVDHATVLERGTQLERQRDILEQAAVSKSEFVASMSHELRTPLNAILGFSRLLLEQVDFTPKHRRYLEHVQDAGTHLLALIGDVLDISRVEAGKTELRPELIGLSGLLEPALAAARLGADAKALSFEAEWPDRVTLAADPLRVREILNNLLSNAIKFTRSGGTVSLRARVAGEDLLIEVADNGIGIPEKSHARVFGAFERLHEDVVSVPGTGLGLALTKKLVELHGGTITFESAAAVGTTFRVCLPGLVAVAWRGEGNAEAAEAAPARSTDRIRVLIVDDDTMMGELLRANIESSTDITVVGVATTVAQGVAMARTLDPTVILMDYLLPDGTGAEAAVALREMQAACAVIVLSVVSERQAVERSILAGAVAYVPKLPRADLLLLAIRRAAAGELLLPAALIREVARKVKGVLDQVLDASERQTVDLACSGLDVEAIAAELGLTVGEMRAQWQSIMAKLSRSEASRAEAVTAEAI